MTEYVIEYGRTEVWSALPYGYGCWYEQCWHSGQAFTRRGARRRALKHAALHNAPMRLRYVGDKP